MSVDAVIIGGGVIGCAAARELAHAGHRVTLLDRSAPESGASWAAAGMLSPQAEADRADPFLDLLLESRRIYPAFAAALREETGRDVGYREEGTLLIALTDDDEAELEDRLTWQREGGLEVDVLSRNELHELEPAVSTEARWGLRFPGDHQVDNRLLAEALWQAAAAAGVRMRRGEQVTRLLRDARQVVGVELASGERIDAEWVVLAGGSWSPQVQGLPRSLPVQPVHGQLLALRPRAELLRHVVNSPRIYLVPRGDGRVIVGATVEQTGFRRQVTASGVHHLLTAALEVVPRLAEAALVESWSGHRPGTPDDRPILGPDPELPNLVYATGHYRNGILLAPVTGLIVEDIVSGNRGRVLDPYSPTRFHRD